MRAGTSTRLLQPPPGLQPVSKLPIDESGVPGLEWPISLTDLNRIRDAALETLIQEARALPATGPDSALRALLPQVAIQLVQDITLSLTVDRFGLHNAPALVPAHRPLLRGLVEGKDAPRPAWVQALTTGTPRPTGPLPLWARHAARTIQWNRRPRPRRSRAMAVTSGRLLSHHATTTPTHVEYRSLASWFRRPPTAGDAPQGHIGRAVASAAEAAHTAVGLDPIPPGNGASPCWAADAEAAARSWTQHLATNAPRLPRQLWTGTGGNMWTRLLALAVEERGGEVVVHDHGNGSGHTGAPMRTPIDLEIATRFVTFNAAQEQGVRDTMRPDLLIRTRHPEIESSPVPLAARTKLAPRVRDPKVVLYASSFYVGERAWLTADIPDAVSLDLEARLFHALTGADYRVIHKPHPGSTAPVPPRLAAIPGVQVRHEPLEQVLPEADVVLFYTVSSSAFGATVASGKPIILLDLGLEPWTPTARRMLEARAAIVPAWFDDHNRVRFDADELVAAIREAPDRNDPSLKETYLAHC